jgi:hypothetical protein
MEFWNCQFTDLSINGCSAKIAFMGTFRKVKHHVFTIKIMYKSTYEKKKTVDGQILRKMQKFQWTDIQSKAVDFKAGFQVGVLHLLIL